MDVTPTARSGGGEEPGDLFGRARAPVRVGHFYPAAGVVVEDAAAHTTGAGDDVVVLARIGGIGEQYREVESTTFRVIANAYAGESSSPLRCCCSSTCSGCAEPEERAHTIGSGGKKKTLRRRGQINESTGRYLPP